jgi:hypothetical protein
VDGVRTLVIPSTARAVATGSAPTANSISNAPAVPPGQVTQAVNIKRQIARGLMQQNPAFFGVGVGQSLDNPKEAALVIYVDRKRIPAELPQTLGGLRTRYVIMDRLHVTRSFAAPFEARGHCMPHPSKQTAGRFDPGNLVKPRKLNLF